MEEIFERLSVQNTVPPQDIGTTDITGTVYKSVARARRVGGRAYSAALANTKTLTVQLMQATDAAGAGAKVLGTTKTYTSTGSTLGQVQTEVDVEQLDIANGFTFVGLRVGSDTNGTVGGGDVYLLERDSIAT